MRYRVAVGLLSVVLLGAPIHSVQAQTIATPGGVLVSIGVGGTQLWDDETRLGTGPILAGGVAVPLGTHLMLAGTVDWASHTREITNRSIDGHLVSAFARATYLFHSEAARVRPIVGGGLGVVRSTGTLTTSLDAPVGAAPSAGASRDVPWTITRAAYDVHAGVRVGVGPRVSVQPEVRWRSTTAPYGSSVPAAIEPPLKQLQGVVSLNVRLF